VTSAATVIDADLLERLRCPQCRSRLVQRGDWLFTVDTNARWKYPIRDGIPVLIAHEGIAVSMDEFAAAVGPAGSGA